MSETISTLETNETTFMSEKTEQLLRELAQKLGTTAEHLWGVLIKQAYVDSIIGIIVFTLAALFAWWLWRFAVAKTTVPASVRASYHAWRVRREALSNTETDIRDHPDYQPPADVLEWNNKCQPDYPNHRPVAEWDGDDWRTFFVWIGLFILSIILAICALVGGSGVMTALLNPEYWALMRILEQIR